MSNELEMKIAKKIITDAISQGFVVSVNDGEETVIRKSTDIKVIMAALGSTDEDYLIFHREVDMLVGGGRRFERIGAVLLIWGNDCDLISEHADNETMTTILKGASDLAEELAA